MKVMRNVVISLVALLALVAILGFLLPRTISVDRSIVINAPQPAVFRIVNSLRAFSLWSPWTTLDPNMKFKFEGPDSGVGQKMTWNSKSGQLGTGSIEIADSLRDERVKLLIKFGTMGQAKSDLTLAPVENGTKVTWSFTSDVGANPFARYMGLVMPGMVGNEYVRGLANLKRYVEVIPQADTSNLVVSRVSVAPQTLIMMRIESDNTPAGMAQALAEAFSTLRQMVADAGLAQNGAPISIAKGVEGKRVILQAALPVKELPQEVKLPNGMQAGQTDEGQALRVTHRGSYATLGTTYVGLLAYALTDGWRIRGSSWNEYVNDPSQVGEADLETSVYLPIE